jgi:hypothetical protein
MLHSSPVERAPEARGRRLRTVENLFYAEQERLSWAATRTNVCVIEDGPASKVLPVCRVCVENEEKLRDDWYSNSPALACHKWGRVNANEPLKAFALCA